MKEQQGGAEAPRPGEDVMIKVTCRRIDSVTVVDLGGRITLGEGATVLRDTIRELLSKGENRILLNLGEVTYIDSSGLGELVSGFSLVRKSGGDLKLLHLTRKVHDLLQITKLYTVFDVQDDEARAIGAFDAPAGV
jgi:anti-sigma B factor antagonist